MTLESPGFQVCATRQTGKFVWKFMVDCGQLDPPNGPGILIGQAKEGSCTPDWKLSANPRR